MKLAEFIHSDIESILKEWETFAASRMPAAATMSPLALRDDAKQILETIARDLTKVQTKRAQVEKSKGDAPESTDAPDTPAETHAFLRAESGFDINQLAAEYRALRASVLRMWMKALGSEVPDADDIVRFNEAIDQALAESIEAFTASVEKSRNLLLGMVGHDLRNPLQAIQMTSQYLAELNAGDKVARAASLLINSSARMEVLLDDLVSFNRTKLGLGIQILPAPVDLAALFTDELDAIRAVVSHRQLELKLAGDLKGDWDGQRLQQLLANLVYNAIKYGAHDSPVEVALVGEAESIRFEVMNLGTSLKPSDLERIFDPLKRGTESRSAEHANESLGLGLFIAREIAVAHGGTIGARSEGSKTIFSVSLPRKQATLQKFYSLGAELKGAELNAPRDESPRLPH